VKYELYLDTFFLLNFFVDTLLLYMLKSVLQCTATHGRLLLGGAAGAAMTCAVILFPWFQAWFKLFFCFAPIGFFMVKFCFRRMDFKQACRATVYLYVLALLLGGILRFLSQWIHTFWTYEIKLLGIVMAAWSCFACLSYWKERKKQSAADDIFSVTLYWKTEKRQVKALLDTGNCLYEPIDKKPVSLVEKEIAELLFGEEYPAYFRMIPFHSVGKKHGVIQGYEVSRLVIEGTNEKITIEKPMIGLVEGPLSAEGAYQMILHPLLFHNQEEDV